MKQNSLKSNDYILVFLISLCILIICTTEAFGDRWYVKVDGSNDNTGNSWNHAYRTVQYAIESSGSGDEIWIKQGIYYFSGSVEINKKLSIYGGFSGVETDLSNREWWENITTFSSQASYEYNFQITNETRLDGLTFTNGRNAVVINNCYAVITNCIFYDNYAFVGAAIAAIDSNSVISNCVFYRNTAKWFGGAIAATYSSSSSNLTIINCTFYGNQVEEHYGGAIFATPSDKVINCIMWENSALEGGPQVYGTSSVEHCDIDQDGYAGSNGNIRQTPSFVYPENGDFHLNPNSPCIDKGTSNAPGLPNTDFEGDSRIIGPAPDIGADEFNIYLPINYTIQIKWWDDSSDGVLGNDAGDYKPLRWATVELYDDDPINDDFIASGSLDQNGSFTFSDVKCDDSDGCDLYVKIILKSDVVEFADFGQADMLTPVDENVTQSLDVSAQMDKAEQSQYAHVFDTILELFNILNLNNISYPQNKAKITIFDDWACSNSSFGLSVYTFFQWQINICEEHVWDHFIIAHELGHHLMFYMYNEEFPEADVKPKPHCQVSEPDGAFALVEGWAEFMQSWFYPDKNFLSTMLCSPNIVYNDIVIHNGCPYTTDCQSRHGNSDIENNNWWQGVDYDRNAEITNPNRNRGNIVEGAVASILWDIFDDNTDEDESAGNIQNGFIKIWYILENYHPNNIVEFYNFFIRAYPQDRKKLNTIFSAHGIPLGNITQIVSPLLLN
jgi:hypothetical protein